MKTDELWLRGVIAEELQDLLLESADVADFLQEVSRYAADIFSGPERPVLCSVTVVRLKKPALVAASGPEALAKDKVQLGAGDGPSLAAARDHRTVYARDLGRDGRWAALSDAAVHGGFLSVVGIPLQLEDRTRAALSLYAEAGPLGVR